MASFGDLNKLQSFGLLLSSLNPRAMDTTMNLLGMQNQLGEQRKRDQREAAAARAINYQQNPNITYQAPGPGKVEGLIDRSPQNLLGLDVFNPDALRTPTASAEQRAPFVQNELLTAYPQQFAQAMAAKSMEGPKVLPAVKPGEMLPTVGADGKISYSTVPGTPAQNKPASVEEYKQALADGFKGSYMDYRSAIARAGTSPQETFRPATDADLKTWGLDPTGSYAVSSLTGRPVVITQPKQANPTEGQMNAGYNAGRISDALGAIGKIIQKDPGAATSIALEGTEGIPYAATIGRMLASDNQQIFRNNMADAVDAIITLGTGAAYTGEQKIAARNAYLPQTGDSEAVRADKYRKLTQVYGLAREKARAAGKDLPEPQVFAQLFGPKQMAPTGPTTQGRVVVQNGWRYQMGPDGQATPLGPVTK